MKHGLGIGNHGCFPETMMSRPPTKHATCLLQLNWLSVRAAQVPLFATCAVNDDQAGPLAVPAWERGMSMFQYHWIVTIP